MSKTILSPSGTNERFLAVELQGNETGELRVEDPEMTAAFVVAIGIEAVRMMRDDPSSRPEETALAAVRRLVAGVVE